MNDFDYVRAESLGAAEAEAKRAGSMVLAGGTTVVDLAKIGVARPERVIDIAGLPGLREIAELDGVLSVGALASMSRVAADPRMPPSVSQSLLLAASAQLRNMATVGGNLLQRTRCAYFRDQAAYPACNKRAPGSGCAAQGAALRDHAVLGGSPSCIAVYPGDLAVALVALGATVQTTRRDIGIEDFFLEPGETPERETVLEAGEIITAILIPRTALARRSTYLKVRDRQSYEFASASAAVGLELAADGRTIVDLRVALGGIATVPRRAVAVEEALRGRALDEAVVREASRAAVEGAVAEEANDYKIALAPVVVARAILTAGAMS